MEIPAAVASLNNESIDDNSTDSTDSTDSVNNNITNNGMKQPWEGRSSYWPLLAALMCLMVSSHVAPFASSSASSPSRGLSRIIKASKSNGTSYYTIDNNTQPPPIHFVIYAQGEPYLTTKRIMVDSIWNDPRVPHVASYDRPRVQALFESYKTKGPDGVPFVAATGQPVSGGAFFQHVLQATNRHDNSSVCGKLKRDALLWVWKPLIIHQQLQTAQDGDWIVYQDASRYQKTGFSGSLAAVVDQMAQLTPHGVSGACLPLNISGVYRKFGTWSCLRNSTLSSVLEQVETQCDDDKNGGDQNDNHDNHDTTTPSSCHQRIARAPMVQASWLVLRKSPQAQRLVRRWMELAFNLTLLARLPFQDQDALGLAAAEQDFPCAWMAPRQNENNNVGGVEENKTEVVDENTTTTTTPSYANGNDVKHLQIFINRAGQDNGWVAVKPSAAQSAVVEPYVGLWDPNLGKPL